MGVVCSAVVRATVALISATVPRYYANNADAPRERCGAEHSEKPQTEYTKKKKRLQFANESTTSGKLVKWSKMH